jgi:hypothetical protein
MADGVIIYRGPSMLDGAPIVVVATGIGDKSSNVKTGNLIQTWILRDDVSPTDAVHSGADASICGACPHRGTVVDGRNVGRSCYVLEFQAPLNVWRTAQRGKYAVAERETLSALFANRMVRLGSYGDPAAVPSWVWSAVTAQAAGWTGYTHQWRNVGAEFATWCMASCDSEQDRTEAKARGYRTFRVRSSDNPLMDAREIVCPASEEAGFKTVCAACKACGGLGAKAKVDIAIIAHGSTARASNYRKRTAA